MEIKKTNCPNCGAVLKNGKCEYCGTTIKDVSTDELYKHLNGNFKPNPYKEQIQSLIDRCEKSIESGEIERQQGLKIIADLRVKIKNN